METRSDSAEFPARHRRLRGGWNGGTSQAGSEAPRPLGAAAPKQPTPPDAAMETQHDLDLRPSIAKWISALGLLACAACGGGGGGSGGGGANDLDAALVELGV